ncbi:hypothetical protein BV372_24060 [Nostoc sp. T09]|uniref:FG-GAP-like repeat-containing protein n=1 Tax=Nostoc sp. T09 TaxID=1932621 RepID=UPI000A3713EF|nr:FG-GAP-like repeat-containing protein [Nostoc sp. T09]OUL29019.1 hypothetical protein BV372_24060 [Nostoc sp. T09]
MSLSFTSANNFPVSSNPSSDPAYVVIKDLDGDAKLDLAVANLTSNDVSVLLNDGNDGFGTPTNFQVGTNPVFLTAEDLNGDNKPDLAVVNVNDNNISVLWNDGSGGFGTPTNFTVGITPTSIAAGDIDGDGKLDLVVANADDYNVSVLWNGGNGSFSTPTNIPLGTRPSTALVGDIDGDGKLDLIVANANNQNVSVLLNDGSGGFGTPTNFTVGMIPYHIVLGDINTDGKLDLVVASYLSNDVSVLLNNGSGGFGTPTNFTVGTSSSSAVLEDIDGDGKLDLVLANANNKNLSVLLNNGSGGFGTPTNFPVETSLADVAVGDIDGDGKPDLVATNRNLDSISLLLYNSAPTDLIFSAISGDGNDGFEKELAINASELGLAANNQITTMVEFTNITENIFTVKSKVKGDKAKLSIKIEGSTSKVVNEIGVFIVDDAQGTIDGIAPGAADYAEVALKRAKVVCSAIANAPDGFNAGDLPRLLEFDSGANLRFYMIRNSTTDAVLSGQTSLSEVVFSSATNVKVESTETEGFSLNWKGLASGSSDLVVKIKETNQDIPLGIALQGKHQGELIDLREAKTKVKAEFIINREAAYDNLVGFCRVNDENGGIDSDRDGKIDFRPGDAGYIKAMLRSRVEGIDLKVNNQGKATFTGSFESGSLFVPFIIASNTIEAILSSNSNDLAVYSPFLGANSDKNNHVRLLGNNIFGFEDQAGAGSDWDYNDLIVQVKLTLDG